MYFSAAFICWFAMGQLPNWLARSPDESCWKTRIGFRSVLRMSDGYALPPRIFVKLPMVESTLRNASGCSHATVNEQMPPLDDPQIARISGSCDSGHFFS